MSTDNVLTLTGTVTRDPEMRFTTGGIAICSFGIAWSPRKKNANGDWENGETTFFNCTTWRDMAENVAASVTKGTRLTVVGPVSMRAWEDKEGNKRQSLEVDVQECSVSLRWATAQVEKTERTTSGGGGNGGGNQDTVIYGDEEPFARDADPLDHRHY